MRMKEAARLLAKTSLRMSEIAERLGYLDSAYFTNAFKKLLVLRLAAIENMHSVK